MPQRGTAFRGNRVSGSGVADRWAPSQYVERKRRSKVPQAPADPCYVGGLAPPRGRPLKYRLPTANVGTSEIFFLFSGLSRMPEADTIVSSPFRRNLLLQAFCRLNLKTEKANFFSEALLTSTGESVRLEPSEKKRTVVKHTCGAN